MQITPLVWAVTIAVTIALFVYEFLAHVRKPHAPSMGESARWSAFYIGLALLFGVGVGLMRLRLASINDLPITEEERQFRWPLGPRPEGHPSLSDLSL